MHVSIFCSFWKFISWTNMPKLWCLTPILIPVPVYLNKTWESELNWVHLSMTSFSTHYSYFVPVLIALRIIQLKFWTCKLILKTCLDVWCVCELNWCCILLTWCESATFVLIWNGCLYAWIDKFLYSIHCNLVLFHCLMDNWWLGMI